MMISQRRFNVPKHETGLSRHDRFIEQSPIVKPADVCATVNFRLSQK